MTRNKHLLLSVFCLLVTPNVSLWAQSIISGDVTGTVTDPTGAIIPGAAVILSNVNTNTSQSTITNAQGSFRFAFIAPGPYQINVSATGFQSQKRGGVIVTAGQPASVTIQLANRRRTPNR